MILACLTCLLDILNQYCYFCTRGFNWIRWSMKNLKWKCKNIIYILFVFVYLALYKPVFKSLFSYFNGICHVFLPKECIGAECRTRTDDMSSKSHCMNRFSVLWSILERLSLQNFFISYDLCPHVRKKVFILLWSQYSR